MPDADAVAATEVALFPIPDLVAFPGTIVPLHVFEPRYRRLVHECVEADRMIGVCHTRKTISKGKKNETLEEALSSNQATYQPHEVFSAGTCDVIETTPDGRILANIHMRQRFSILEDVQALPYRIVTCRPLDDVPEPDQAAGNRDLQGMINARLIELSGEQSAEMAKHLDGDAWKALDPAEFSFRLFQFVRFDADFMQTILESTSASERLNIVWDILAPR